VLARASPGARAFRLASKEAANATGDRDATLVPAFPLDGGRVLRALLAWRLPYVSATRLASTIGRGLSVAFGVAGLFGNPMLVLVAVFIWFAAGAERRQVELQSALGDEPAGRLAVGSLAPLSPSDRLADAARTFLGTGASALAVFDGGAPVGALRRDDLEADLARLGPNAFVAHARLSELAVVPASQPLSESLQVVGPRGVAILEDARGRVLGLVTAERILSYAGFARAVSEYEAARAVRERRTADAFAQG